MERTILICDKCEHQEVGDKIYEMKKSGWKEFSLKTGGYSNERTLKNYLVCPKCSEDLGLAAENKMNSEEYKSLADRLLDLIVELVDERLDNNK